MPDGAVYVGRPTFWGNPYVVGTVPGPSWPKPTFDAADAVECYRLLLAGGWALKLPPGLEIVTRAQRELEGLDLVCWCPPSSPCHADVLLEYANEAMMIEPPI